MRFRPEQYDAIIMRLVLGSDGAVECPANPNMLVPWFLMAAYAYEELDDPFLTDGGWEWVCGELYAKWDAIEHRHKHLIDRAALGTGTASYLVGALPTCIQHAAKALMRDYRNPDEVGRPVVQLLPTPDLSDLSDLLGTIAKVEQDIADLIGLTKAVIEPTRSSLADLL